MERQDLRGCSEAEKLMVRKRAIRMIKKGVKKKEISDHLGVNKNTITNWWKSYQQMGSKSYHYEKRGLKKGEKKLLTDEQEELVQSMIVDKMPDQLRLPFALWTRKAVKELIDREFGLSLGLTTVGDYLRSWGFSPQKPSKRAYEQNPKKVQKWLDEEYPAIKKKAKQEDAEIHWADETGVKNNCNHGRSYAPKGKTPIKRKMGKCLSLNMISSVTNQGKVQFMFYHDTMDADKFIGFIKQLIKSSSKKVYAIVDNLRVHHAKIVKKWLEGHKHEVEVFYLPSYSPEMNPDEYLNCDLKQGISDKKMPKTKENLIENVNEHMNMLQSKPDRVKKYFEHKSISYAA